jgi:hypothetical protein
VKRLVELLKGVEMAESHSKPRALFLFPDIDPEPDYVVCSGLLPSHLKGQHCPYSDHGNIPLDMEASGLDTRDMQEVYEPLAFAPSCIVLYLGRLGDWQGEIPLKYPEEMAHLPLFKCMQMFLLVIPGMEKDLSGVEDPTVDL